MSNENFPKSLPQIKHNDNSNALFFENKIWCVKDVAKFLDVSIGHIYNLTSRDDIPFRKKGKRGKLYFLPEEIFDWINEEDMDDHPLTGAG